MKTYTINIERKRLLKQRREKASQNAKDRKLAKENFLAALEADHKADRASNDTQSSANMNDELINGSNADTVIYVDNINNIEIVAENVTNAATNAEDIVTASINADNIVHAEIDNEKSEEIAVSDNNVDDATLGNDNIDNIAMSDNNIDDAELGNGNTKNTIPGETTTEDVPSPLLYGRKTTDPSKVKTSKKCKPIWVKPS